MWLHRPTHPPPLVLDTHQAFCAHWHLQTSLRSQAVAVPLSKEDWNERAQIGDFHLAFSTSWGGPYDPHAFASAWGAPNEGDFAAQQGETQAPTSDPLLQLALCLLLP